MPLIVDDGHWAKVVDSFMRAARTGRILPCPLRVHKPVGCTIVLDARSVLALFLQIDSGLKMFLSRSTPPEVLNSK